MRSMRHKNVVFFFGAGQIDNLPFLVMEYCERGGLNDILLDKSIPLDWPRMLGFALDTATV